MEQERESRMDTVPDVSILDKEVKVRLSAPSHCARLAFVTQKRIPDKFLHISNPFADQPGYSGYAQLYRLPRYGGS